MLPVRSLTADRHHRRPERGEERQEHVEVPCLGIPEEVREPRHEGRGRVPRDVLGLQ